MSTLILDKVLSGYNLAKVNDNFERIEKAFNEALLHRDGSKELTDDLDVNNQKLLNVRGIEIDGVDITESVNQLREEYTSLIDGIQEYQSILDGILAEAISYGAVDKKSIGNAQTTFTTTQNYAANATLTLPLPYVVGKNTLRLNQNHYYEFFKGVDYEEVGTFNTQSTTIKLLKPVSTGVVFEQLVDGDNDLYSIYSTAEALQTLLTTSYSPESISAFVDAVSDIEELGLEDKIDQLNTQYEQLVAYSTALQTTVADINTKYSTITDMYEDMGTKYSLLETLYPQLLNLISDTDFDLDDLNSAIGDLNDAIEDINEAMEDIQGYADAASDSATEAAGSASDAADSALEAASYVSTINTSVNNARIWAEGTDTEVATLLGTHSAKEWAEQAESVQNAVKYTSQSLTTAQKTQARTNIDAFNVGDGITATGSTTARTLANRFADVINVKDFGAKGDGVTDDRDALNAALSYAAENGKALSLDGIYRTSSGWIEIPSDTHLIGSPGTAIVRCYNTADGHAALASVVPKTGESTIHDVTIEGVIFDGNGQNFDAVSFNTLGWDAAPARNIVIRDCEFWNIIDYHAVDVSCTDGLLIDNCAFKGWVHKYSDDVPATRREMIQLQGSVGATYQNKNVIIQNCWFGASDDMGAPPAGIGNHGWEDALGSDVIKDIIIRNNTFVGCSWYGVSVYGWQNVLIDGNNFINCRALGLQSRPAGDSASNDAIVKNVKFVNNTCRRDTQGSEAMNFWIPGGYASLLSRYTDITDVFPQDILIEGNTFDNYNSSAVFVVGKNIRFVNNDIYRGAVYFFRVNGIEIGGNTFNDSYVWNASTSGYVPAADYPETDDCKKNYIIRTNFFRELRQRSIYIANTNSGLDVSGNIVFNVNHAANNAIAPIEIVYGNKFVSVHDNTLINLQPYRTAFVSVVQDDTYTIYANRYFKQGVVTNPYLNTVVESYVPASMYQALESRVAALEA